jgi:hypothetical protein
MNRRAFLGSLLASGCGLGIYARSGAAGADPADNEKPILSAPLTHSDWMLKSGMAWGIAGVKHMLDACRACGWSRVYWRVLDGGRAMYQSRLVRAEGKWDEGNFWEPTTEQDKRFADQFTANLTQQKKQEIIRKFESLDYAHFDTLAAAVTYGHQIGLQVHAWVSINEDDHGWGLQSDFSKQHAGFRWVHRDGRSYHSQLSFAFPEVRAYKLAILRELLENYPIDGLFLDWIRTGDVRDNPQTDRDGVADSGYEPPLVKKFKESFGLDPHDVPNGDERWVRVRAEPQTAMMREIRKLGDSGGRRVPVAVMVSHPWHYRGLQNKIDGNLRGLLLDVNAWAREGLMDSAIAAGYYRDGGTPELAWQALRKETEEKIDIWVYGWVPRDVPEFERDVALARKLGAKHLLFWEADYIDDRPNAAELRAAMARAAS